MKPDEKTASTGWRAAVADEMSAVEAASLGTSSRPIMAREAVATGAE